MKTRVLPNLLITACRLAGTNGIIKKENMKKLILGVFLAVCWCTGTANAQDIAAKTNLLYWSSTTPNLSFEFGLGKRTTLDGSVVILGGLIFANSPLCIHIS